jgi:signal transduction histidine kinase
MEQITKKFQLPIRDRLIYQTMVETGQPIIIDDTHTQPDAITPATKELRAYVCIPISWQGDIVGFLDLLSTTPNFFKQEHVQWLQTFASQAAIAIQNARLHQQAQEIAASVERERIAQDLHDAVSQTLFSANIIADSLPRIWEKDYEKGKKYTTQLSQLTRRAKAEMRELLAELRPNSLTDVNLDELLRQLANTFTIKTQIEVVLDLETGIRLPEDIQIVFYRVTQEALSNIAKHADATQVNILTFRQPNWIDLYISDNGKGFAQSNPPTPGHFGIGVMRERAKSINAELTIHSRVGEGSRIRLSWSEIAKY